MELVVGVYSSYNMSISVSDLLQEWGLEDVIVVFEGTYIHSSYRFYFNQH